MNNIFNYRHTLTQLSKHEVFVFRVISFLFIMCLIEIIIL